MKQRNKEWAYDIAVIIAIALLSFCIGTIVETQIYNDAHIDAFIQSFGN